MGQDARPGDLYEPPFVTISAPPPRADQRIRELERDHPLGFGQSPAAGQPAAMKGGATLLRMRWLAAMWIAGWVLFSMPWSAPTADPQWHRARLPRVHSYSRVRPDHVLNVLFYIPVAPIGAAVGLTVSQAVLAGALFSATAETVQLFSRTRAPDGNDLVANVGGAALGALVVVVWRRTRRTSGSFAS